MNGPVIDVGRLPVILRIEEVAGIYRLSSRTVRRKLQANEFRPLPFDTFPYRWLRDDVIRDLQKPRIKQKHRRMGFAVTKAKRETE